MSSDKPPSSNPPSNVPSSNSPLDNKQRNKMLNELKSLSGILDSEEEKPAFDDLPVLKSFVEDVPILNDRIQHDRDFLDDDPLAISASVRQQHRAGTGEEPLEPNFHLDRNSDHAEPTGASSRARSEYERFRDQHFQSAARPTEKFATSKRLDAEKPLDAGEELRKLLNAPSVGRPRFDLDPTSQEYQKLRQKASLVVNDIIRASLPRLEAELRMKLETEVDRILKEGR
ncbi:hypothetical protein HDN1F_21560 [gamma proteobacterium HdN1]|nr:hypothetical protein HDN1F_21560 [gamma proteobacterium HdN1]